MLESVKYKLEGILTSCASIERAKGEIKNIVANINSYLDSDKQVTDLHRTFRTIEEYDTMFKVETNKFMGIPQTMHYDRIYQAQEILCICSLILSYITRQLKKYNTEATETRGTTAKALRQLAEVKEQYKCEKMSWGGILKAETAVLTALMDEAKLKLTT